MNHLWFIIFLSIFFLSKPAVPCFHLPNLLYLWFNMRGLASGSVANKTATFKMRFNKKPALAGGYLNLFVRICGSVFELMFQRAVEIFFMGVESF